MAALSASLQLALPARVQHARIAPSSTRCRQALPSGPGRRFVSRRLPRPACAAKKSSSDSGASPEGGQQEAPLAADLPSSSPQPSSAQPAEEGQQPAVPELSQEDLEVVVQWVQSVGQQEASRTGGAAAGRPGGAKQPPGAAAEAQGTEVPVLRPLEDPFPDKEPEGLSPVEPLEDPRSTLGRKARQARKKGEEALSAGQDAAAAAADLAAAAVDQAAQAAQEEALFSAAQLAGNVASDAADVVGSVATAAADVQQKAGQDEPMAAAAKVAGDMASDAADVVESVAAAAADVQQKAADALTGGSKGAGKGVSSKPAGQLSPPEPPAGELKAPKPPAGELPAVPTPAGAISSPKPPAGELSSAPGPAGALPAETSGGAAGTAAAPAAASSSSGSAAAPPPPPAGGEEEGVEKRGEEIAALKESLVGMLASLDRGAAATEDQVERVEGLVKRLEALGGPVSLTWDRPGKRGKSGMALLDGRWRLLYSSGFASGSLGGRRPGPSFGSGPFTLGQVHQDIFCDKDELDNVVDLFLRASIASLPLPGLDASVPSATARLKHSFRILGASTVEITFTDTEVKLAGGLRGWLDSVPRFTVPSLPEWLQPAQSLRSARFDVVFLDEEMRITRGDRGEVRVFLKGMV